MSAEDTLLTCSVLNTRLDPHGGLNHRTPSVCCGSCGSTQKGLCLACSYGNEMNGRIKRVPKISGLRHPIAGPAGLLVIVFMATAVVACGIGSPDSRSDSPAVSAGRGQTCGVRDDGSIACWGDDYSGRATPPEGQFTYVSAGDYHSCGVRDDGTIVCWGNDDHGQATPPKGRFVSVSAGLAHACGVTRDGSAACWGGANTHGQATPPEDPFASVSVGDAHVCGLMDDGSIACWGNDDHGQATPPKGRFVSVSAGGDHTCGVRDDGSVVCWG